MKVFKFGGASVKDAESVRNVASVLKRFPNENIIVVISAMGKITNALEKLTDAFFFSAERRSPSILADRKDDPNKILAEIISYHFDIIKKLFPDNSHSVYSDVNSVFEEIKKRISTAPSDNYNSEYDQIVSQGEIISTKIVSAYLNTAGINSHWMDAREMIQTDSNYREANVNF